MNHQNAMYGMSWKQRQEYRANRSTQIAAKKDAKTATLSRLANIIITIEDAFKPEADMLHAQIVKAWDKAYRFVLANGKDFNTVRTAYTGIDVEKCPEWKGGFKNVNGRGYGEFTAEYKAHMSVTEPYDRARAKFADTKEAAICIYKIYTAQAIFDHATKDADEIVEANKFKLLDGVARYMQEYQTAEVKECFVTRHVKGFQGEFILTTDKGVRILSARAITAQGPVISFHWRYIIHVKTVS